MMDEVDIREVLGTRGQQLDRDKLPPRREDLDGADDRVSTEQSR